jgi:CheY-like chemotaxis protein
VRQFSDKPRNEKGGKMTTILLAEDNANLRDYCRRELEDEGYRVVAARDGVEATEMFDRESPDLAVLDICMPVKNGLEVAEQIHGVSPQTLIIFFTSFDEACLQDERSRYAAACVEKDADLTELKRVINGLLASRTRGPAYRSGLPPPVCAD